MLLAYVVAFALAAGFGALELMSRLRARPTLREGAWYWWSFRLAIDGGAALLATWAISEVGANSWTPLVIGIVGGASASAILRQQFTTLGETPIGVALVYNLVRDYFDGEIDRRGSENDSKWINEEVLPALIAAGVSPAEVAKRLTDFVAGLSRMDDAAIIDEQTTIREIERDEKTEDRPKLEALIEIARRLKAFRTLRNLYASAKRRIG